MKKLTMYEKILYLAMTKNLVEMTAYLLLSESSQIVYRAIRDAISNGHLKKHTAPFSEKKIKSKITYYSITISGIKYLVENSSNKIQWLKFINSFNSRIIIKGKKSLSLQNVERYLRITTSAIMAEQIGAQVLPMFLATETITINEDKESHTFEKESDEDKSKCSSPDDKKIESEDDPNKKGITLAEIVCEAIRKNEEHSVTTRNGKIKEENNTIVFISAATIKKAIVKDLNDITGYHDIMRCRYTAFLENRYTSLAVYVASPTGMSWQRKFYQKEVATHSLYNTHYSDYRVVKHNDNRAVIMIENAKKFSNIYLGKDKKRNPKDKLGEGYTHFFAVPIDNNGKQQLSMLMNENIDSARETIVNEAADSGFYEINKEFNSNIVPLKDKTGALVFLGVDMDIIRMQRMESLMSNFPNNKYAILCYPWQTRYYESIFPKVKLSTLEKI